MSYIGTGATVSAGPFGFNDSISTTGPEWIKFFTEYRKYFSMIRNITNWVSGVDTTLAKWTAQQLVALNFTEFVFGATINPGTTLTNTVWNSYRDFLLTDDGSGEGYAKWAFDNGVTVFCIANEVDILTLSGITLAQLRDLERTLATDVKALCPGIKIVLSISQGGGGGSSDTLWIADGNKGDIDYMALNCYGTSPNGSAPTFETLSTNWYGAWGANSMLTECNLPYQTTVANQIYKNYNRTKLGWNRVYAEALLDRVNFVRTLGYRAAYIYEYIWANGPASPPMNFSCLKYSNDQTSFRSQRHTFESGGITQAMSRLLGRRVEYSFDGVQS